MRTRRLVTGLLVVVLVVSTAAATTAGGAAADGREAASPVVTEAPSSDDDGLSARSARSARAAGNVCASGVRWLGACAVSGYALNRSCGKAWCGLVGTLAGKRKRFYRADPMASSWPNGFSRMKRTQTSPTRRNHCGWGRKRGNTAGYILSRYGKVGADNRESTAVDLAVTHVLCQPKKRWRIGGDANNKRLREAGRRYGFGKARKRAIKSRARAIVREARRQHGPYRLRVAASDTTGGGSVTVTARLRTRTDHAAGNRRLVLRRADGSTSDAYTNSNGVARWSFSMSSGTERVTVRAPRLEEYRVYYKSPSRRASTRLVIAGKHYATAKSVAVAVKAVPRLRVRASSAQVPEPLRARMSYTGSLGSGERKVTVRLRGPGWASMNCTTSNIVRSRTWTLDSNGTYRLPKPGGTWAPKRGRRYYRWQVTVAGDAKNVERSTCSSPVRLRRAEPVIRKRRMNPEPGTVFRKGQRIKPANFRYQGGYGSARRKVRTRLWGPFGTRAAASCSAGPAKLARAKRWALDGNGRYGLIRPGRKVRLRRSGWYRFQVIVKGDRSNERATRCGPGFRVR